MLDTSKVSEVLRIDSTEVADANTLVIWGLNSLVSLVSVNVIVRALKSCSLL